MLGKIKKSISDFDHLLTKRLKYLYILNFLLILTVSVFEIIGIGSIFVFIGTILDPAKFLAEYKDIFIVNYLINLDDESRLKILSIFLIVFFIIKGFVIFISQYSFGKFRYESICNISSNLFQGYLRKNYNFYLNYNPSLLNQRILSASRSASDYMEYYLRLINSIFFTLSILIILLYSSSQVGLLNVVIVCVVLFVSRITLKNSIIKRSEIKNANDVELFKTIQHAFGSFTETKLFKKELFFIRYFNKYLRAREFQAFFLLLINALPKILLEILFITVLGLVLIFFVKTSENLISVLPLLTLIVVSLIRLLPALQLLLISLNTLKFTSVGKEIVLNDIKNMHNDNTNLNVKQNDHKISFKESIKIKNLCFKYDNSEKLVLRDFNLEINPGEKIAITGVSGSGKSTFVNILTGLLPPSSGNILVDNESIFKNLKNWQSLISYIPQNIYLIDDTVENNITFSTEDTVKDKEFLDQVLKLSNIYDDIYKLKDKTNTLVGDRGIKLSGGQKQRIAIARALYKKPQILIMDEPTSGLDKETEQILFNNIFSVSKSLTLIIISHNIEMHGGKFKVYKLENGILNKK